MPPPPPKHPHVPTLHLKGSPYELGLQHGHLAKDLISNNIKTYTAFFQETAGLSWSEAKQRSTTFIPTIQGLYPQILEEIRGIADGSQLSLEDILALNVRSEIALTNYDNTAPPAITDGCTAIAQLSQDRSRLILAQNWDWVEDLQNGTVILDILDAHGRTKLYTMTEAGLVGKIGVNSHGLGICINALRCGAFADTRLPTHIMARYVLEHATDFESCVESLRKFGGACTFNMLIADPGSRFGSVEVTPHGISLLQPTSISATTEETGGSFVAHTNHVITAPDGFPLGVIYDRPAPHSFTRLARITELTKSDAENNVPVSVETVYARLKDREGDPYGICRGLPVNARGMEKMKTLATIVVEMDIGNKSVRGEVTIGRPCEEGLQREEWRF